MAYTPGTVTSIQQLNTELTKISNALADTLQRKPKDGNFMDTNLDMNSKRILNLPEPISETEPARVKDVAEIASAAQGKKLVRSSTEGFPEVGIYPEGTELKFYDTLDEYVLIRSETGVLQWVEEGNVGDEVPVTAASHLTLAQAQASDLRVGQYAVLKDRNNPFCLVVSSSETEDIIATLDNGNKLQVQPSGSAVFVEWFGATTTSNSSAAIELAVRFADKHSIKFVDGYGVFPVDDGQIDVSNCESVNIRVSTRKTVPNERTFYCANGVNMAWEKAEHFGANDYDGTQRNSVAIELDSCTNTHVRLCDFDKFGDASVRYRECDGLKIERTTTQGPDGITQGDNFSFGIRSYNQVNGSKDVELSFNEVTGTAIAFFGSRDENTILTGNVSKSTLGQHGYYYEPRGKFTATGNHAISPALGGAKVQIQVSSEIGETHRSILLNGFVVTDHTGGVGVEVNVASGASEFYEDLSITNCVCSNGQTGINGENILRGNVANNVVSGMTAYGIFLEKFEGVANDNMIHNTGWASLAFEAMQDTCHASGNNISKFAVLGDTTVGIRRTAIYASGVQHLHLSGNTVTRDGSTAWYSVASPNSLLHFDGGNNLPMDAPIDVGSRDNIQTLDDSKRGVIRVSGVSVPLPTELKQGKGHREFHGPAIPTAADGYFFQGDIVWNTDTSVGQPMYWRCVVSGTPGTWQAFDVRN